ncbi:MAG: reactive intermediate/imine deaminase [Candidatus Poribacteria bacterium]|nr:MAG: reactive intermediate/imine deaminase [Candidatus Poribacteria bacterium]
MRQVIRTPEAGPPQGAYSQAIRVGNMVYTAGMAAIDPKTGKLLYPGDIEKQTEQTLRNIEATLKAAGTSLEHVVRVRAFIHDIREWAKFNAAYQRFFPKDPPARTTVQVGLPEGMCVEIDVDAVIPDS